MDKLNEKIKYKIINLEKRIFRKSFKKDFF